MQNRKKKDTDLQNSLLDSVGEGEGGMFQENILSRVKQITSPGWMHETSARAWCTGKTQRVWVEREVGGGIGMGSTYKPMAVSFQCMTKSTTNKKNLRKNIYMYTYTYIKNIQPYICKSHCYIPESNATLYINYMSIKIHAYMAIVLKKRSELAKSLQTLSINEETRPMTEAEINDPSKSL